VECAFDIVTAKWRFLKKAIETKVNKAGRIVMCICLLRNIIIDLEGTTHDSSVQKKLRNSWMPSGHNKSQR
jgi:hypothetical protein